MKNKANNKLSVSPYQKKNQLLSEKSVVQKLVVKKKAFSSH